MGKQESYYIVSHLNLNLIVCFLSSFNQKRVDELIDFLTVMPPDGCSHDRGHK